MATESVVNIPITANQAFDAVVQQTDPATGEKKNVALVDVRTTAEYFWVGASARANRITTTSGTEFLPHNGKVELQWGTILHFKAEDHRGRLQTILLPVRDVASIETVDISIHVPTHIWDEASSSKYPNPHFAASLESLSADFDVLILMCRSGKRSNTRDFDTSLFEAIYEIDDPNGANGHGGFQGTSYNDAFNGYRGYPGRDAYVQDKTSASWSDAGLPVHIGWAPFPPDVAVPETSRNTSDPVVSR
jgi:rhodanese-related sulfurtransferase